jgi:hypothetical protein
MSTSTSWEPRTERGGLGVDHGSPETPQRGHAYAPATSPPASTIKIAPRPPHRIALCYTPAQQVRGPPAWTRPGCPTNRIP